MKQPLVINLRGNSGSGKTYLTREFMRSCKSFSPSLPGPALDDQFFLFGRQKWVVLGRYGNACGGCDTIKTQQEIIDRVECYTNLGFNVWLEGLIMSTIYGTVGAYSEQFGDRWVFAYLFPPIETCIQRIKARRKKVGNLKPLNEVNTRNREATIVRNHEKVVNEFHRRAIILPLHNSLEPILKIIRKEG